MQHNSTIDEPACHYVCSRGLLKNCVNHSLKPISSIDNIIDQDLTKLEDGDTLYVCSNALSCFVIHHLSKINKKFILLSGDSDNSVPCGSLTAENFIRLLTNKYLIVWFTQNLVYSPKVFPKLQYLPIGLDYHTIYENEMWWGPRSSPIIQESLLFAVAKKGKPLNERIPIAYTTFHFVLDRGDRQKAYDEISKDVVYYEPERVTRLVSWKRQIEHAFVLSPPGAGYDCHRTWEALCLGCIPIMISTPLDELFEGLPVLIVKSWRDITWDLLNNTISEYSKKEFCMDKLKMSYWLDKINSYKNM
jgi:hypothetical protein